jgi:hypothetical protein
MISESNDNGLRIIDFAMEKGMKVSSPYFPHKDVHKETWVAPDGVTRNQIDHILILEDMHWTSRMSVVREGLTVTQITLW